MSERKLLHKSESQTLTLGHDLSTDNSVIVTLQPVPPPQRTSSPATTTTPTTTPTPTRDTYCLKDVTGWRHRKLNYLWERKNTKPFLLFQSQDTIISVYMALLHGNLVVVLHDNSSSSRAAPFTTTDINFSDNKWRTIHLNYTQSGYVL